MIIENEDGSVSQETPYQTKQIRASNGTFQTLVSFDEGLTWRLKANEHEERVRLARVENIDEARKLRFGAWKKNEGRKPTEQHPWNQRANALRKAKAEKSSGMVTGGNLIIPRIGSHVKGKNKGKNAKYKKNLRKRVPAGKNVVIAKPVHEHVCRIHNARFVCCCDKPRTSRRCGPDGKTCNYSTLMEQFAKGETFTADVLKEETNPEVREISRKVNAKFY